VNPETRSGAIETALRQRLAAEHVVVADHSARHADHPGAAGGGHFELVVVSERFEGLSRVAAQRLVYEALGDLMKTEIHALTMTTLTPGQWRDRRDDS
jgi:BolA protein